MLMRYSAFSTLAKYAVSMAQGFFVCRQSVAITLFPLCAMMVFENFGRLRSRKTPFSVEREDQLPLPYLWVRCSAAALRTAAIAPASASVAVAKDSFIVQ